MSRFWREISRTEEELGHEGALAQRQERVTLGLLEKPERADGPEKIAAYLAKKMRRRGTGFWS